MDTIKIINYDESSDDLVICPMCGSTSFRVFITSIIDDARLYCTDCGHKW